MESTNNALVMAIANDMLVNIAINKIVLIDGLNKRIDMGELKELADSIKHNGVQTPIMVRGSGDKYELIAGHRRVEASRLAGLVEIPAIVKMMSNREAVVSNGIENLARKNLNPVEEGETLYAIALAMGTKGKAASAREVGRAVGKNNATVSARFKLANASDMLKSAVRNGKLDCERADRLIKDGKDDEASITEAMTEAAIAKVKGSLKRADTIAGVSTTPEVVAPKVEPVVVNDSTIELDEDDLEAAEKIAGIMDKKESVTEKVIDSMGKVDLPLNEGGNLDIPNASPKVAPTVTIIPPKDAPVIKNEAPVAREPKAIRMDTMKSLLECVAELLRDEPTDSARYPFLQGVQYGYQVMCGLDTDANIPEAWEDNL